MGVRYGDKFNQKYKKVNKGKNKKAASALLKGHTDEKLQKR